MRTHTLMLLSLSTCTMIALGCSPQQLDEIESASDARARVCLGVAGLDSSDAAVLRAQQACAVGAGVAEVGAAIGGCRASDTASQTPPEPSVPEETPPAAAIEASIPSTLPAASPLPAGN
jgi:hypothetical protein